MSKSKKSTKKHRQSSSLADVTINDFANSSVCKNRIKKLTANVSKIVLKQLEDDKEEKNWDEKDDFDVEFIQEEDGTVTCKTNPKKNIPPRRRRKTKSSSDDLPATEFETNTNEYPLDVWFLLSEYIRPEDVGRFAGICKSTNEVVSTAKFWYSLYRRHYKPTIALPERLQPECLFRKYGIRTSVIRALNYMYKPFVTRLSSIEKYQQHPDLVKRTQCVLMWHRKTDNHCVYFFKMKNHSNRRFGHHRKSNGRTPDILEMLDDAFANQDESCRILQITCKHLIPIAPVLGLTLTSAQMHLSSELRNYKLQLWFGSEISQLQNGIGGDTVAILLEPVINVRVLDWWHPLYPHNYNIEHLLNQE